MKIRSLIVLLALALALAVIAGGAVASDAVGIAAHGAASTPGAASALTVDDMRPLAAIYVPGGQLGAVDMPKCADCH